MYNDCETLVSTRPGDKEYFHVRVGLHQGSAISPFLFILIMDALHAEVGQEPPWVMFCADDLVICEHSRAGELSCSLRDGERHLSPTGSRGIIRGVWFRAKIIKLADYFKRLH